MDIRENFYSKLQQIREDVDLATNRNAADKFIKNAYDKKLPMDKIQSDPTMSLGYDKVKDPKTGILDIKKEKDPNNWGSYDKLGNTISVADKVSRERYKATAAHELGHAGSVHANPTELKKNSDGSYSLTGIYGKTEELRQRRADLQHRSGESRNDSLKFTQKLHDRDQISLDKINDDTRNKSRQILYKKYGSPDRASMTDRDLGKVATGTIIPEETKMDIRENFYSKLQTIREEAEVKPNKNSRVRDTQDAALRALQRLKKNDYEGAQEHVKGTSLHQGLKKHLDDAQKNWTKMNKLNNSSHKAKSEEHYNEIRNRANDHQDQAEHHHGKAVEYLKGHLPG